LGPEFTERLAASLPAADRERSRLTYAQYARWALPILLLVGPIIGWRLLSISPHAVHIAIDVVAWAAFLLDVGVHIDTSVLHYLGLGALPAGVGVLLFLLVGLTLLWEDRP
jgi:hypothetical protein